MKVKSIKLIFITFSAVFSCTHELEIVEKPKNLIPADSFELVLSDLMLMEALVKTKHAKVQDFHLIMKGTGAAVLKKHKIDSLRFQQSMDYYAQKQEELIEIYRNIQDDINLKTLANDTSKVAKDTIIN